MKVLFNVVLALAIASSSLVYANPPKNVAPTKVAATKNGSPGTVGSPAVSVVPALGQPYDPNKQVSAADFKTVINNVVFSLETIEDVVKSLKVQNNAAGQAISKRVSAELLTRFYTAVDLYGAILVDDKMSQDQKEQALDPLGAALGELAFTVYMHPHEDPINTKKTIDEVVSAGTNLGKILSKLWTGVREYYVLGRGLVTWQRDIDGNSHWAMAARITREKTGQQLAQKLAELSHNYLSQLDPSSAIRQAEVKDWRDDILGPSLRLRMHRLGAQHLTALSFFGATVVAFITGWPLPVDYVGMISGHNDFSYGQSADFTAGTLLAIGAIQTMTASGTTAERLRFAVQAFDNPEAEIPPLDLNESLGSKIKRLFTNVISVCQVSMSSLTGHRK